MFTSHEAFIKQFTVERDNTLKMFDALTDKSLGQAVANDHRTLGRMAWHIVTTYPEMVAHAGLDFGSLKPDAPLPQSASDIQRGYRAVTEEFLTKVSSGWNDATLAEEKNFYGENWKIGFMLEVLLRHEIHHRGQMTVLMRQAGLTVPGVYGPAKEEWVNYGAQPPEV